MDKSVYRVIRAQVVLTLVISIALVAFMDLRHALSALCGGAIAVLSAYVYARKMRTPAGADAGMALRAQYRAELYKLAITIGLFALVFLIFRNAVAASSFFLTYLATVLAYWLALVVRTNT